jgi:NifU-like protein involved in Fe-S cluster formation
MIWAVVLPLCIFILASAAVACVWLHGLTLAERTKTRAERDVKVRELRGISEQRAKEATERYEALLRAIDEQKNQIAGLKTQISFGKR